MTGRSELHLKRSWSGAALLLGLLSRAPAHADTLHTAPTGREAVPDAGAPSSVAADPVEPNSVTEANTGRSLEPTWDWVKLRLEVGPLVPACPDADQLASWVNELVGRAFVAEGAPVALSIRVDQTAKNELLVQIAAEEQATALTAGQPAVLRQFQRADSCSELLRATALTISLFATAASVGKPRSEGGAATIAMTHDWAGPSLELRPSPLVQLEPTAVDTAPAVPLNPAPNVLPVPSPSDVEAHATAPELHPIVRAGADGALGVNPGIGLGANLQIGIRSTHWGLWLRAGYLTSTGRRFSAAAPGTIHGPTSELQLAICRMVSGQVTLSLCGFGGQLWVYARGEGFDRDRHALLNTAAVGASTELLWTINSYFAIGPRLDLLVPLAPVRYQVAGEPGSWRMWPVAPRVGLGVEWR